MKACWIFLSFILLTSCGQNLWWTEVTKTRSPASVAASPAYSQEAYFLQEMEGKLRMLRGYYGVGRKHLQALDMELASNPKAFLSSPFYQKLLAVKLKAREIEAELFKSRDQLKNQRKVDRLKLMDQKISDFGSSSLLSYLATKTLRERLGLKVAPLKLDRHVLENEQNGMLQTRDYLTHQMTIDHLAHALSFKSKDKGMTTIDTLDWMPQLPEELKLRTKLLGKKAKWETLTERKQNCKLEGMTSLSEDTLCPQS